MEKEASKAVFESMGTIDLKTSFASEHALYEKAFRRFLLSLETWPLTEISIEKW